MKKGIIIAVLLCVLFPFLLSSCKSKNEPERTSINLTCVNASQYYAKVYLDGLNVTSLNSGVTKTIQVSNLSFSYYVKVDIHEYSNSDKTKYKTDVYNSYYFKSYKFSPKYDYKLTISNDGGHMQAIKL